MAMTVVDKDCTEKAECFVNTVAEANYERGFKDGYAKAIEEFAEQIKAEIANCSWQFSRLEAETIDKIAISIVRGKE